MPTKGAPPLPPRASSSTTAPLSPYTDDDDPPSYDSVAPPKTTSDELWTSGDPRSSSTQSLVPSESNEQNERRRLLLIYIHGFMGNETSFRSFPAHVHNLLTVLLVETHVVHTKVYPRYRSKRNISFARDDFSKWLEPHEDPKTDVVLLGHSMGGLLSAEVVLMSPTAPASRSLKHRILGTINFDVPFLGMHPGVVKSGLASIFKSEEAADKWSPEIRPVPSNDAGSVSTLSLSSQGDRTDTLWQPPKPDPNFNPSFQNDVVLPMRKGWRNALHFVHKHSDNFGELTKATKQLVTSHLEFGGAMANYGELKGRYGKIRVLEEDNDGVRKSVIKDNNNVAPPRVRFVNYYTASTGRLKKRRRSPQRLLSPGGNESQTSLSASLTEDAARGRSEVGTTASTVARSQSPRISLQEHSDDGVVVKTPDIPSSDDEDWEEAAETLTIGESDSTPSQSRVEDSHVLSTTSTLSTTASTPPIPDMPSAPPPLDVSYIQDAETRKLVEKEHARAVKAYEKAVKDRVKAIQNRSKLEAKHDKKAKKEAQDAEKARQTVPEKEMSQKQGEELRLEKEEQRMEAEGRRLRGELPTSPGPSSVLSPQLSNISATQSALSRSPSRSPSDDSTAKGKHPKRDHMFCTLPPKDSNGERDPTWVRVYMENVDEVGAHCGLFFVDERYERLVGDVASRIEGWVRDDSDAMVATEAERFQSRFFQQAGMKSALDRLGTPPVD